MSLNARDCSPLQPQPTTAEVKWLRRLQESLRTADHIVSLSEAREDDEPVVYCEHDGTWWTGRYVGSITFEGRRLTITPRFGIATLREWLSAVTHMTLVESNGILKEDESFITQLLAAIWVRSFVDAARHGLPALRQDSHHVGRVARGRIDVAATVQLRAAGTHHQLHSVQRQRSLDHAVSEVIVAAFNVLRRRMGPSTPQWLPQRCEDLLCHLQGVTGPRPKVPSKLELARVRYTPITQRFRSFAQLSRQIALHRGLYADPASDGGCHGVLLDIAEVWELYVLAVLRLAASDMQVQHGTRDAVAAWLLHNHDGSRDLARLKPDAIVAHEGRFVGIADAKYKSLQPTRFAPDGPQREDLYQMAAYLARFVPKNSAAWGLLCYPEFATSPPTAETAGPWRMEQGQSLWFLTIPHTKDAAIAKLRATVLAGV